MFRKLLVPVIVLVLMVAVVISADDRIVDLRYGVDKKSQHSFHFFDFVFPGKRWTFEALTLGDATAREFDFGVGQSFAKGKVNATFMVYFSFGNNDSRWVYVGVPYTFQLGKLSGEGFPYYFIPTGGNAIHFHGGLPVIGVYYPLSKRWSLGVSLDAVKFEGDPKYYTKTGPSLRLLRGSNFWEGRLAHNSATGGAEFQLRRVFIW